MEAKKNKNYQLALVLIDPALHDEGEISVVDIKGLQPFSKNDWYLIQIPDEKIKVKIQNGMGNLEWQIHETSNNTTTATYLGDFFSK